MTLEQKNEQTITNRFDSVMLLKNLGIRSMMKKTLNKAMAYALSEHEANHVNHLIYGNTYGWMIVHDGVVEELVVNSGKKGNGKADGQLLHVASLVPDKGWYGVLLASMNEHENAHDAMKAHSQYYVVSYERAILLDTVNMTSTEFDSLFVKLKVTK